MKKKYSREFLFKILFIIYSCCLLYFMFIGYYRSEIPVRDQFAYNIIPFKTISYMYGIYKQHYVYSSINLIGNVLAFIPLGFFLAFFFKKLRNVIIFSITFISIIIVLELLQMFLNVGTADIDDLILNYPGGLLGFCLFHIYNSYFNIKK